MPDRALVIDHLKFSYEGIFNASEFYALITEFFYNRNWDWHEKLNEEIITQKGKQIKLVFKPWKNASDYYKMNLNIQVIISDLKDVEIEHDGEQLRLNQGLIKIQIDGFIINDRNGIWQVKEKPFYWLLTVIFDKYLFKRNFEKFERWIKHDVDELLYQMKTFLNVYKYSEHI
jgi:hypothetical protein